MTMQQKMFVGPRGVMTVVIEAELKTASGAEVVTVHYDGGHKELMTKKTYELVSTTEPTDFTIIRNKKFDAMTKELYPLIAQYISSIASDMTPEGKSAARHSFLASAVSTITEYDIKVSEIEPFLNPFIAELNGVVNAIGYELDNSFNRATNFMWTKDDTQFVPGTNMMMERTLLEAQQVNSTIPAPEPVEAKVEEIPAQDEPEPTPAE